MKPLLIILAFVGLLSALLRAAEFDAVKILPRQDHPTRIHDYRIEVSNDSTTWTKIATGTLDDTAVEKTIALTKQAATLIRITALTGSDDVGAAIAEISLTLAGVPLDRAEWAASADSEAPEAGLQYGPASYAIDGLPGTCWHTSFPNGITPLPHSITIDTLGVIHGDSIILVWDANPEPYIGGYSIAYGRDPAILDKLAVLGKVTEATLTGLAPGVWYFAARAKNGETGVEGPFCQPVSYKFSGVVSAIPASVARLRAKRPASKITPPAAQ